jgi:glycosyltransferase involved in cell wall biosynthesis
MIAFHYPPLRGSSGIQRTLAFSRDLREHGWGPVVLTAHPRAYPNAGDDLLGDVPTDVPVHRAFAFDTSRHLSLRGAYPKLLALPDRWSSWCLGAIPSGLGIVRRYRPEVLWSTYPIATAHLIGWGLHAITGVPWVADFRDSMTEPHYPPDATVRGVYRRIERAAVAHAARAVFTTPGAREMYARRYPRVPVDRWAVIPNGYDERSFVEAEREPRPPNRAGAPLVLVHSGLLYPSERDPRAFFAAVAELKRQGRVSPATLRIVLRASGYDEDYRPMLRDAGIDDIVHFEPPIAYRDALAEMLAADGLLLFQASNCNHQIPAKLYEYLRARRPILAMTDPGGDTAAVLAQAGIDTVVPLDSKAAIAEGLERFLESLLRGSAPVVSAAAVGRYSRRSQARDLATVLAAAAGR